MRRGAAPLLALLAAAGGCEDEKPKARTVPLSESKEGKALRDAESAAEAVARKAAAAAALDQAAVEAEPEAELEPAGEVVLEPGKAWLTLPGLGVDVGVAPGVTVAKAAGGEVVLTDGTDQLRVRRAAGAWDRGAIVKRLEKEAGGPVGVVVDRSEKNDVRLEYVVKDRKSGEPSYGLVMRREIDGRAVECWSRGARTNSTFMALEACRRMRATPR
ncbi:MAG TPA: hypothetical protein VFU21_17850 [Kofleriaceae bacterium]|nr:hypothetical protein [Kofleriaceae bacterium]